eukprot:249999_1
MSRFSRIFQRVLQLSVPSSFTMYCASSVHVSETKTRDEEDCETPICHDADEAIKEYSQFLNKNANKTRNVSFMIQPPDRQQLGRHSWTLLHTMAAYWPNNPTEEQKQNVIQFLQLLGELYPCSVCAADLKYELIEHPPNVNNRDEFIEWICDLHNRINKKLHKPTFNCKQHQKRWKRQPNYTWRDIQEVEEDEEVEFDDEFDY